METIEIIEEIRGISYRTGGILVQTQDGKEVWINPDIEKAVELMELIKEFKKGDKVRFEGYEKDGRSYYTSIKKVNSAVEQAVKTPIENVFNSKPQQNSSVPIYTQPYGSLTEKDRLMAKMNAINNTMARFDMMTRIAEAKKDEALFAAITLDYSMILAEARRLYKDLTKEDW